MKKLLSLAFLFCSIVIHASTPTPGTQLWLLGKKTVQSVADVMITQDIAAAGTITISTSGTYALAENISSTAATAINITASNVRLDLNGHTLTSTTTGVTINASSDVRVCNGFITNCTGIYIPGTANNSVLEGLQISPSSGGTGISVNNAASTNIYIDNCFVIGPCATGIATSAQGYIKSCMVSGITGSGILITGNGSTIDNTIANACGASGFQFTEGTATLNYCQSNSNGAHGFANTVALTSPHAESLLYRCVANGNTGNGFDSSGVHPIIFVECEAHVNTIGFNSTSSASEFHACSAFASANIGFFVTTATPCELISCVSVGSPTGFQDGTGNSIFYNCFSRALTTNYSGLLTPTSIFSLNSSAVLSASYWMNAAP